MKYFYFLIVFAVGLYVISLDNAYAEKEIPISVGNDVRKLYYSGENIISAYFVPETASVIFETSKNANLDIKAPKIYKTGESLLVLINGEEVDAVKRSDDCFYYITYNSTASEKIEIIFAHWPEATELLDACDTSKTRIPPPLKQIKLGIKLGQIICNDDMTPVWNIHYKPACLTDTTYDKLLIRGWAKLRLILPASGDPIKELELIGQNELTLRFTGSVNVGDEQPLSIDRKRELAWEYVQDYHPDQKIILEYATDGLYPFHKQCDVVNFDLLEWGNFNGCWDLDLTILNSTHDIMYQKKINQVCYEPSSTLGTFAKYSSGINFDGFRCQKPGLYLVQVENDEAHFPSTIIDTFVCTSEIGESKCPSGVVPFDSR